MQLLRKQSFTKKAHLKIEPVHKKQSVYHTLLFLQKNMKRESYEMVGKNVWPKYNKLGDLRENPLLLCNLLLFQSQVFEN